jgi:hypothetical protein
LHRKQQIVNMGFKKDQEQKLMALAGKY